MIQKPGEFLPAEFYDSRFDPRLMKGLKPNELLPNLQGINAKNPVIGSIAAMRRQMESVQVGQAPTVSGAEPRRFGSGVERDFGQYTFRIVMPTDGTILAIIPRYRRLYGVDINDRDNPSYTVIYECHENNELACFELESYHTAHPTFPVKYRKIKEPQLGRSYGRGEVFYVAPSVNEEGDYGQGLNVPTVFLSLPATADDGILASERLKEFSKLVVHQEYTISWGSDKKPLNVHGTDEVYLPFPKLGQVIGDDNIVMALRSVREDGLSPVLFSKRNLRRPNPTYDQVYYAAGAGGKVVNIEIIRDNSKQLAMDDLDPLNPERLAIQYDNARRRYSAAVYEFYAKQRGSRGQGLRLSTELRKLVETALATHVTTDGAVLQNMRALEQKVGKKSGGRIAQVNRKQPLDTYTAKFTIEYTLESELGFKATNDFGGKGVFVKWMPHEDMPKTADGDTAWIVVSPESVVNRNNSGSTVEHYVNASGRDTLRRLSARCGIELGKPYEQTLAQFRSIDQNVARSVYNDLCEWYACVSPTYWKIIVEESQSAWHELISHIFAKCMTRLGEPVLEVKRPTHEYAPIPATVQALRSNPLFRANRSCLTYRDNGGGLIETEDTAIVGSIYWIWLEKIADDGSASSSAKLQVQGLISPMSKAERSLAPFRNQSTRGTGEAEGRIIVAYCGPVTAAEHVDRNTSPLTHGEACFNLMISEKPSAIRRIIDRNRIKFGSSRPLVLLRHNYHTQGVELLYKPYNAADANYDRPEYLTNQAAAADDKEKEEDE